MASFLQMCLRVPNLGTLLFFIVFVLAIPSYLVSTNQMDSFKYYLPLLVMVASTLTESGKPRYFQSLYPEQPDTMSAFLSKNFINLLAIVGILINVLVVGMTSNNLVNGLITGVITFMITFPIAGQVIPFFIRQTDYLLKDNTTFVFHGNWHKYFTGLVFIVAFMSLEMLILRMSNNMVVGSKLSKSVLNNNMIS